MAVTLRLIRHAPTHSQGIYSGHTDSPCIMPACYDATLAAPLKNPEAKWFSSDLSRSLTTSRWLRSQLGIAGEPTVHSALREQNFGAWEGETYNAIYEKNPELNWNQPARIKPPSGESFVQTMARVSEWLPAILSNDVLVIVAHAGSIRSIIAHALNLSPEQALCLRVDTGSMSCIEYYDSSGILVFMNRPFLSTTEATSS